MLGSRKPALFFAFIFSLVFVNSIFIHAQTVSPSVYELKPGTRIRVKMETEINSESSNKDDTFLVKVAKPLAVKGITLLSIGDTLEGRVTNAKPAGGGGKNGTLEVVFETLKFDRGETRKIEAVLVKKLEMKSSQTKSVLAILGGTAIGGILGAITKADNGALIGAGIGAGAGTGAALLRKGKEVRIKTDETFEIVLTKSVTLPPQGF
ncbi:MAG: hypothetical protein HKN25_08030 [Pyrinomonadaceae bacterium]|nr:hypothetical protein [Pyrinomonadaceae bacterium]